MFLLNTHIDPLPIERWERLVSNCGLKGGWFDKLENVESNYNSILVVKQELSRFMLGAQ